MFVCVNCGSQAQSLYKEYSSGVLKISYCSACGKAIDHYIETDVSIILIDAALQRLESYRHFMFNTTPSRGWKFGVICVLCDAYVKWAAQRLINGKPESYLELEWSFYMACLQATLENSVFFLTIYAILCFFSATQMRPQSLFGCLMTVAGCGKLFTIPAVLWDTQQINHTLITAFVLVSMIQACRALDGSWSRFKALFIVFSAFGLQTLVAKLSFSTFVVFL